MPHFADIILPVPLQGLFTYSLPADLAAQARVGSRVVVPFGTKKTQTGLIARLHDNSPAGIEVKAILEIMDEQPVVLPTQLNLWQWIADYYLCSIGEVFKAALPGKMKRAGGESTGGESWGGESGAWGESALFIFPGSAALKTSPMEQR